jgi:hypothetical protein
MSITLVVAFVPRFTTKAVLFDPVPLSHVSPSDNPECFHEYGV